MRKIRSMVLAAALLALAAPAQAQNCLGRPDFDQCMAGFNNMNQQRLAQSQQQLFQQYVQTNGPWLRENYARHRAGGGQMSPDQFAWWGLTTANGTNIAGAAQAQRDRFAGQQAANRTVQEGHASYNRGMANNSARMDEAARNYSNGAVRGVAPYVDPRTGQAVMLPYMPTPGVPFASGGEAYVQGRDGTYYQRQGNGWTSMSPGR